MATLPFLSELPQCTIVRGFPSWRHENRTPIYSWLRAHFGPDRLRTFTRVWFIASGLTGLWLWLIEDEVKPPRVILDDDPRTIAFHKYRAMEEWEDQCKAGPIRHQEPYSSVRIFPVDTLQLPDLGFLAMSNTGR
jgi:hypothetical protein